MVSDRYREEFGARVKERLGEKRLVAFDSDKRNQSVAGREEERTRERRAQGGEPPFGR